MRKGLLLPIWKLLLYSFVKSLVKLCVRRRSLLSQIHILEKPNFENGTSKTISPTAMQFYACELISLVHPIVLGHELESCTGETKVRMDCYDYF